MVQKTDNIKASMTGSMKAANQQVRGRTGIYATLAKEHGMVDALFKKLLSASSADRKTELFQEIKTSLLEHAENEDAYFYQALEDHPETKEQIAEFRREHAEVEKMLEELSAMSTDDEKWLEKVRALHESVEAHVEKEEKNLFSKADDVLSRSDSRSIDAYHSTRSATDEQSATP